jgi:endonuclease YncB( thermonuclease family)
MRPTRLLACVDGGDVMVNAELARQGDAPVATSPPNVKHQDWCLPRQRDAREAEAGCWGASR